MERRARSPSRSGAAPRLPPRSSSPTTRSLGTLEFRDVNPHNLKRQMDEKLEIKWKLGLYSSSLHSALRFLRYTDFQTTRLKQQAIYLPSTDFNNEGLVRALPPGAHGRHDHVRQ